MYTVKAEKSIMPIRKVVILGLVALVFAAGVAFFVKGADELIADKISLQERTQVDTWIVVNDLNQYGDPNDTAYAGGTPLFNEATGQSMDRYEYILQRHPGRPWGE